MKPGYKQTEVGVIPEDWEVREVVEICEYQNGTSLEHLFTSDEGLKVISIGNYSVTGGYIDNYVHINHKHRKQIEKYVLMRNDLAMSLNDKTSVGAIIGRVLLIKEDNLFVFNQRTMRLRPKKNVSHSYLHHTINADYVHDTIVRLAKPGTQIYVNTDDVIRLKIPLPPLPEQRAIAAALSDVDALLAGLERLIAKKRDLKQAAMQQLLTGQTRLPGFHGAWEVKRLGEIADILKGNALSKSQIKNSGSNLCILYGELFTTYGRVITNIFSRTDSNEGCLSLHGDILLPGSTTTTGIDLAIASALLIDNVALGGDIIIVRCRGVVYDSIFLANYLTYVKKLEIAELTQGITIHHLYGKTLKPLMIELPPLPEQIAIAEVLSNMDAELAALETQLHKTRAIKQGMMQELLTGRTRLV